MSYPINYPTPQNADVQIFSIGGSTSNWVKPQGCSFVYFTLFGAGGNGAGGSSTVGGGGGASGAYAIFLCPAFLIPDVLRVSVGRGGVGNTTANRTRVLYQLKDGSGYELLFAASGANATGTTGGSNPSGMGQNYFTAMGFLAFNTGQGGANAGASIIQVSFLTSAGAGGGATLGTDGGSVTPLFNYPVIAGGSGSATPTDGKDGISILSNLLLACGGAGGGAAQNLPTAIGANGGDGGFGSGGGGGGRGSAAGNSQGGRGGDGLVVIISW
jgi:hypothetical protein